MRKLMMGIAVLVLLAWGSTADAQITDGGFEAWSAGAPTGWSTDNVPGADTVIWRTTDAHSGSYAVEGVATSYLSAVIPPTLTLMMPWTSRPSSFTGYYKYAPVSGDTLIIAAVFAKNSSAIGAGLVKLTAAMASYTQFSIPISYSSSVTPDSTAIQIGIIPASGSSSVHAGSLFKVDDVSYTGATGVSTDNAQTPLSYTLGQNYPNPFNPTTVIQYQLPASGQVSLKVYDELGREVAALVDTRENAGTYSVKFDGGNLASGVYFYRLSAGTYSETKKLLLIK